MLDYNLQASLILNKTCPSKGSIWFYVFIFIANALQIVQHSPTHICIVQSPPGFVVVTFSFILGLCWELLWLCEWTQGLKVSHRYDLWSQVMYTMEIRDIDIPLGEYLFTIFWSERSHAISYETDMGVTIYTFYNTGDFDFILNFTSQFKERLNIGLDKNQWILLVGKSNVCKKIILRRNKLLGKVQVLSS